jgi:hypothetical protein
MCSKNMKSGIPRLREIEYEARSRTSSDDASGATRLLAHELKKMQAQVGSFSAPYLEGMPSKFALPKSRIRNSYALPGPPPCKCAPSNMYLIFSIWKARSVNRLTRSDPSASLVWVLLQSLHVKSSARFRKMFEASPCIQLPHRKDRCAMKLSD